MKQLERIIGLPKIHIYSFGENNFRPEHCIETTELIEYGGCETIYTDKDFSWAIYFSHEGTVSFAGSIVPIAKNLLLTKKSTGTLLNGTENNKVILSISRASFNLCVTKSNDNPIFVKMAISIQKEGQAIVCPSFQTVDKPALG